MLSAMPAAFLVALGPLLAGAMPTPVAPQWQYPMLPKLPTKLLGLETDKPPLYFDEDGRYRILQFSDNHFGERWGNRTWSDWGPANDNMTQNVQRILLEYESPDLVAYNGDQVTGENLFAYNSTAYLDQCFNQTYLAGIPWFTSHGNHDNSEYINHGRELEYEIAHYGGPDGLSYTRSDAGQKVWGEGNYWLPIWAKPPPWKRMLNRVLPKRFHKRMLGKPALIVFTLDSRSYNSGTGAGPGYTPPAADHYWVDENEVPRYMRQQRNLMYQTWGSIPPVIFMVHIPFNMPASNQWQINITSGGATDDNPYPAAQGMLNNTYTGLDTLAFSEIVAFDEGRGNVLAVSSGHDHGDGYCARTVNSSGITTCYDQHTGYGGYVTPNTQVRSGRLFEFNLKDLALPFPKAKTYLTFENMTRGDYVTLSNDYMANFN